MGDTLSRTGRGAAGAIALVAWAGLIVQLDASWTQTGSAAAAIWAMLRFFTVIANLLVAIVLTGIAAGRHAFAAPVSLGGATLAIVLVGVVYALLLNGLLDLSGGAWLADRLLHWITPTLVPLYWLAFASKGGLRRRDPLLWAILPLAYFGYALARGAIDGNYAYPFIDVTRIGWARTLANALAVAIGFFVTGFLLVWLDAALAARVRHT